MTYYELFDQATGNLLADFDSEAAAFAFLLRQHFPLSAIRGLEVLRIDDGGRYSVVATSEVIVDRLSPPPTVATGAVELYETASGDIVAVGGTGQSVYDLRIAQVSRAPDESLVLVNVGAGDTGALEAISDRYVYPVERVADEPAPVVPVGPRVA